MLGGLKAAFRTWIVDGEWLKDLLEIRNSEMAVNACTISKIHWTELNGLTYFPHQFERLNCFFQIHKSLKINVTVELAAQKYFCWRARGYSKREVIYNNWLRWIENALQKHEARYRKNNYGNCTWPMWVHDCESERDTHNVSQKQTNKSGLIY